VSAVVFYFQVHQPYRLRRYRYFDIGESEDYFDDVENERILRRVASRCYLPANAVLLRAIEESAGRFKCSFSITGTALSQMEAWAPEALESFQALAKTGCVEFLCETAFHSLAALASPREFADQVAAQRTRVTRLFGRAPTTFRDTELIFDERIARTVEDLGFDALLGEGADHLLAGRSPHHVYRPAGCETLKLLLRDYRFSDDIAFRFSNRLWPEYPLMADRFARWLGEVPEDEPFVGLFMDFETFGEHQWADTGILDFLAALPRFALADERLSFATPSEVARAEEPAATLAVAAPISWADQERDVSAWLGNHMQRAAHESLYALEEDVRKAARRGRPELLEAWRKLTTSDHVYYMSTKKYSDQDVHEYFSPHESPHDSFFLFMNVLDDLGARVARAVQPRTKRRKVQ
jgi:alpha-amylase